MKSYSPIIKPIITEKSSNQQSQKQYTFIVDKNATKIDVKTTIKKIYGVDADKVKIINTVSKARLIKNGKSFIKKPKFKKAIVTLKGKKTIDPNKIKPKEPKK